MVMNEEERWNYLLTLDDELLKGGVILSEWCSLMVRESDLAFAKGAFLSSIITAVSAIETYLRSEYETAKKDSLFQILQKADFDKELANEINTIRQFRNKFVHVDNPWHDQPLLEDEQFVTDNIEKMAFRAVKALRKTLYSSQFI